MAEALRPTEGLVDELRERWNVALDEDALPLKRIHRSGMDEQTLITFPNATRAVISPDFQWIAFREYTRTFVTPYEFVGKPLTISAADKQGFTQRVDVGLDGDFTEWTSSSDALYWTRGQEHCAKTLAAVLEASDQVATTDLSFEYEIARR